MGYAYPIDSKVVTNPNGTVDYDRASSSAQLRGLIKSMITNGVNLTESTNLQVMADEETMNLVVKPGYVIIEGALKHFEDDVKVTIGAADTTNPRIDTVVARLNLNEDVRDIVIDVLQGTPAAEPMAPELTRTTSYYEVGLADILIEVGATQISQAVVTDTRLLNSRCGMISAIGEIDTETLFNQLTTDFDNWFESIKGKLGDDVAGGLQMQIDSLADDIDTLQEDVEILKGNDSTMIWDISENLYSELESRNVSTLPRDITNGYVVKLNDIFYMLGGGTVGSDNLSPAQTTYKYVDGVWVEDTVLGALSINKNFNIYPGKETIRDACQFTTGGAVSNNNKLYYTQYSKNAQNKSNYVAVYTYDGKAKGSVGRYFGYNSSDYYRLGNVAVALSSASDTTLSFSQNAFLTSSSYSSTHRYGLNMGGASSSSYVALNSIEMGTYGNGEKFKILQPHNQGVTFEGYPTFLISQRDIGSIYTYSNTNYYDYIYKYYLVKLNLDGTIRETIHLPDHIKLVTDMVCINDYIYITYNDGFVWRYKNKWEKVYGFSAHGHKFNGSLVEHEGEIHRFTGTTHTAHKLYRKAKTYAPKGTKIYLPYETAATSTNLQPIEGGYVVTESGNVELKIYDY